MKTNKWIIYISIITIIITFVLAIIIEIGNIWSNIVIGILTGSIVSLFSAVINYIAEKQRIVGNIKKAIPILYCNLLLIKKTLGNIIPQIPQEVLLGNLNYSRITSLAKNNIDYSLTCNLDLYSGINKSGKVWKNIAQFSDFVNDLYNLKNCINKLEIAVLESDSYQLQLNNKAMIGQMITVDENNLLIQKRHLVTVQSAKIHEYETSLIIKLDEIAIAFCNHNINLWNIQKESLEQESNKILNEYK